MDLINSLKNKNFTLLDWFTNSISLPSLQKDLPLGPYFNFIKKKAKKIPGDIVEFGVYRGDSIIATALLLKRNKIKKKIIGFDTFDGFLKKHRKDDVKIFKDLFLKKEISPKHYKWIELREKALKLKLIENHEWKNTSFKFVKQRIKKFKLQKNIELIKGDIVKSVKKIKKNHKYSVVFMDCNLYEPHIAALEHCWKHLSKKGTIFLDDYFSLKYPGARIAVNEFCKNKKLKVKKVQSYPGDFERYYLEKS
jgi:hypothetical protein|tara:strand:+ start:5097 stop:5849 length:753 start_codon:yes stop_codon:yes gene_type:complete